MLNFTVGVAMGEGSDVAKEAADIVLMDSRFSSITVGIEYGRLVFDNLRKVVIYLMTFVILFDSTHSFQCW